MNLKICNYIKEHKNQFKTAIFFIVIGLIYYIITQLTSFRIPCPIQSITGLFCPGCGITHFFICIVHLDFIGAVKENYAVAFLIIVLGIPKLIQIIWKPNCLKKNSRLWQILIFISLIFVIIFGILRNISGFEFLLPSYAK